jgi:hypothetical protein
MKNNILKELKKIKLMIKNLQNTSNIIDKCSLWKLPKLECEIKEFVSLSDAPEFTSEINSLWEKYGESFDFYQEFNILHHRKY